MRVDNETSAIFRLAPKWRAGYYQTLKKKELRQFAQGLTLADLLLETIRKELHQV